MLAELVGDDPAEQGVEADIVDQPGPAIPDSAQPVRRDAARSEVIACVEDHPQGEVPVSFDQARLAASAASSGVMSPCRRTCSKAAPNRRARRWIAADRMVDPER